jgi:DNA-binding transcriptional ArsR family regulator
MTIQLGNALSSDKRLLVLQWLKRPTEHFRPQVDGDLVKDGVCLLLLAEKLRISPPTASVHLKILCDAGLLKSKKIKKWIFYKRDELGIRAARKRLREML